MIYSVSFNQLDSVPVQVFTGTSGGVPFNGTINNVIVEIIRSRLEPLGFLQATYLVKLEATTSSVLNTFLESLLSKLKRGKVEAQIKIGSFYLSIDKIDFFDLGISNIPLLEKASSAKIAWVECKVRQV